MPSKKRSRGRRGKSDAGQPTWWQRNLKRVVAVIGALGIVGAVGSRIVDLGAEQVATRVDDAKSPTLVSVREDPQGGSDGFGLAARSAAGLEPKLRQARDCAGLFDVAKRAGAVDIGQSVTSVLLEGRTRRDVTIVDLRARVVRREPPLRGAVISCASAGAEDAIGVAVNLDERTPVAREIGDDFQPKGPYFARGKVVTLKKAELQPLAVYARTQRSYVEWLIDVDAIVDGKQRKVTISNHGQPFRLTARRPANDYGHFFEWVWYEQPSHLYSGTSEKPVPGAQPAPRTPEPPPGARPCQASDPSEWVGPTASCAFARNIRRAYRRRGGSGAATMTVFSPKTRTTYSVTCTADRPHACTTETGAVVYLR
jgi:hypothetical protein